MAVIGTKTLGEGYQIMIIDHDPNVEAIEARHGTLIIRTGIECPEWYIKKEDGLNTDVCQVMQINNYKATSDPTINDDITRHYSPGSEWINTTTGQFFKCIDSSTGAAVWISPGAGQ